MHYDTDTKRLFGLCEEIANNACDTPLVLVYSENTENPASLQEASVASALSDTVVVRLSGETLPHVILDCLQADDKASAWAAYTQADVLIVSSFQYPARKTMTQDTTVDNILQPRLHAGKVTVVLSEQDIFEGAYTDKCKALFETARCFRV